MVNMKTELKSLLLKEEGFRQYPYVDTTGHITIGIGRNLTDKGISQAEGFYLLENDIDYFLNKLSDQLSFFEKLSPIRQMVLVSIAFNCGMVGLMRFRHMLSAMEKGDWANAYTELKNSRAATQAPRRYDALAYMLLNDELPSN